MKDHDVFWDLGVLSDRQLLERMGSMLGSSRRLMAELIAHLARWRSDDYTSSQLVAPCLRIA